MAERLLRYLTRTVDYGFTPSPKNKKAKSPVKNTSLRNGSTRPLPAS